MIRNASIPALLLCCWLTACATAEPDAVPNSGVESESGAAPALAYNVREGRTVFQHYCAPCHGVEGGGDGFNAYNLDPRPRDLADPDFQQTRSDEDLAAVVRAGGGVSGLSDSMPPWGRSLNDRQIHNVVRFVRHLSEQAEEEDEE